MDLNPIATFVRVVEDGSFTAAAAALHVPKSSVSRSVARLERDLGVRLLQRTTRKLRVTDAGREYFERVRPHVTALRDATEAVTEAGKEPAGVVRVSAPVDMGHALLAPFVADFVQRYPRIRVELSLTSRRVDLVQEGFDLAVRAGELADSSLVARKLGTTRLGLFAAAAYLAGRGKPKAVADLGQHDCILFRGTAGRAIWTLRGPDGDETVEVEGKIDADDLEFVARAIAQGAGIGMLPMFLCEKNATVSPVTGERVTELVRVLPKHSMMAAPVNVVSPSARHEPARVRLFREELVAAMRGVPWGGGER